MSEMSLIELFGVFFYIGLFTIGGGMVAITLMQQSLVDTGFISSDQFYNMIAISEATPGPIGINMATYIGWTLHGVAGGIIATFAQVLPSIITIVIIAKFLTIFKNSKIVENIFIVLRPAATGLVLAAAVKICSIVLVQVPQDLSILLTKKGWQDFFIWKNLAFYLALLSLSRKFDIHPIILIILGALFGIIFI